MKGIVHPAKKLWMIVWVLVLLCIVLSFITVFVPWSWKDVAPGARIWAYPFRNCVEYTFSSLNAESCQDNDYTAADSVSGGSHKCRGFIIATIVFVFTCVITGVLTLIVLPFVIFRIWAKPRALACLAQFGVFVTFSAAMIAWIMWIIYAEETCQQGSVLFPLRGYSYGFIIHVFASFLALIAVILGYWALVLMFTYDPSVADKFLAMDGLDPEELAVPTPINMPQYVQYPYPY